MQKTENEQKNKPYPAKQRIHLVGIGGSGLSAIAAVLLGRGYKVTGSDLQLNEQTAELSMSGATIFEGHDAAYCEGSDLVLVSSAIPEMNPEIVAAKKAGIPVVKRSEFLGRLMEGSYGIAIAGSHGKTTTTGMVAQILIAADLDPTVIVGGVLPLLGSNGRAGKGDHFVIEADEYDHMFHGLRPNLAVITNIGYDHPDLFTSELEYKNAFHEFVRLLPQGGRLIACADDPGSAELTRVTVLEDVTVEQYGLGKADWRADDLRTNQLGGTDFLVEHNGQYLGVARLRVPGEHNVRNALAAIAVAHSVGIEFNVIRQALAKFGGISRRFQIVGEVGDVTVIDDYAHHPTEIKTTLAAARQRYPGRRLWAVWQPHTFSRTKRFLDDFATCFADADSVVALDIFQSRETDNLGVDTPTVLQAMDRSNAYHLATVSEAASFILDRIRPGDVIVTLTAGDGNLVGKEVLLGLQKALVNGRMAPGRFKPR